MPILIELDSDGVGEPINVTSTGDALNLTINMTELAGSTLDGSEASTVTFPPRETTVITSFASISFPPGVTASYVPTNGLLVLRISSEMLPGEQVQRDLAYGGSGRVELQKIVEVGGSGGSGRVTFDMPVRILLEGQGGGRAFYIGGTGGEITPIDMACAADDTARVHRQLGGAGECQIDSDDGADKIIHTYHFTLFGTVLSELGVPPPILHTCSARLGMLDLGVRSAPGAYSPPVRQNLINSGSLPLAGVGLEATPWYVDWDGGGTPAAGHPSLPASISEVSEAGPRDGYGEVVDGTAVARGLEGGNVAPLWFRANLTSYDEAQGSALVQSTAYVAECVAPAP